MSHNASEGLIRSTSRIQRCGTSSTVCNSLICDPSSRISVVCPKMVYPYFFETCYTRVCLTLKPFVIMTS